LRENEIFETSMYSNTMSASKISFSEKLTTYRGAFPELIE